MSSPGAWLQLNDNDDDDGANHPFLSFISMSYPVVVPFIILSSSVLINPGRYMSLFPLQVRKLGSILNKKFAHG